MRPFASLVRTFSHTARHHSTIRPCFVLYSGGSECLLCDEAIDLLDALEADFDLDVVNIRAPETDKALRRRYQYSIPVLTLEVCINLAWVRWNEADEREQGKEVMHGKITKSRVLQALDQWHGQQEKQQ